MTQRFSIDDALAAVRDAERAGTISTPTANNATRWLSERPFTRYQSDIVTLVGTKNWDEVTRLFWQVIPFGTGGRRGPMADFGSATINDRTIAESAHGLAAYLKTTEKGGEFSAVVAHDTRNRSADFAKLTATTLAAHGVKVYVFKSHRSTPELSYAVRHLQCDVGAMISASHNPPEDNGFKAYWSNGGQVLPPHDKGIIQCVEQAGEIPTADYIDCLQLGTIVELDDEIDDRYIAHIEDLSLSEKRGVKAVYTPLHGVGETSIYKALQACGFEHVSIFEPQRTPSGNFDNVPDHLPNPERAQVFEPVVGFAKEQDAALILASDPDADRVATSVRNASGEYVPLTGNQAGVLLADYALRKKKERGELNEKLVVVETVVTTGLISKIARSYGVEVVDDLPVGFKYIGRTIDEKEAEGKSFLFGAEESLGYLAGDYARDKDAAVGSLWLLEMAEELAEEGKTLHDRLDELYAEHGYFLERQFSKACAGESGQELVAKIIKTFREHPPTEVGGFGLDHVRDYLRQEVRALPHNRFRNKIDVDEVELLFFESPRSLFQFQFAVRPSGTEPKMKFYLFAQMDCESPEELADVKQNTARLLKQVETSLSEWVDAAEKA